MELERGPHCNFDADFRYELEDGPRATGLRVARSWLGERDGRIKCTAGRERGVGGHSAGRERGVGGREELGAGEVAEARRLRWLGVRRERGRGGGAPCDIP